MFGPEEGFHAAFVADIDDALAFDGDGARPGRVCVDGIDRTVPEDDVGPRPGSGDGLGDERGRRRTRDGGGRCKARAAAQRLAPRQAASVRGRGDLGVIPEIRPVTSDAHDRCSFCPIRTLNA